MEAPSPDRHGRAQRSLGAAAVVALAGFLAALGPAAIPARAAMPARAGAPQTAAPPDQVFRLNPRRRRGPKLTTLLGQVTEYSLESVRIKRDDKEQKYPSSEIVRVVWGDVPPAFKDGQVYGQRGDHQNAVAKYRVAATDASARDVVRAAARLRSAESLLAWGTADPAKFAECVLEVDRLLVDHPENRDVPHARWIKARAILLGGDAAGAAAGYRSLYEQGATEPPSVGYDRELCLNAGLRAAWAYVSASDTLAARELFTSLVGAFGTLAAAQTEPAAAARLAGAQGEALAGEGFCLLESEQAEDAKRFFEARLRDATTPNGRHAALLGLAEAHTALSQHRLAQIAFAKVSAIDHTGRDRAARARVGLAGAGLELQDSGAEEEARKLLTEVRDSYGDTPSAAVAAEMLDKL